MFYMLSSSVFFFKQRALAQRNRVNQNTIRALLLAFAVKFNISSRRWQHFRLWPLFLLRDKGKRTEITGTQQRELKNINVSIYIKL
jgi:hypothetical protein